MTLTEQVARFLARHEHTRLSAAVPANKEAYIDAKVERHWRDYVSRAEGVIRLVRQHSTPERVDDIAFKATMQHHPLSGRT
jgi:hypothetical protein